MSFFRVEKLVKTFGGLTAVNEVSFEVQEGEIFGLIGPNGSGKTTLFNMISGVYTPTSGKVVYKDREIQGMKPYKICEMGIGRTFQVVKPLGRMTVRDNVIAASFSRVNSMREARDSAMEILDFCGLTPVKGVLAKSLPIAGRKRLEIARAMATRPRPSPSRRDGGGAEPDRAPLRHQPDPQDPQEWHDDHHHRAHHARDHVDLRPDPRHQLRPDDRRGDARRRSRRTRR